MIWDTHVHPLSTWVTPWSPHVSNIQLVPCPLFTNTGLDLVIVKTPESLATTLIQCKQHLQTILVSPQQLLHHNGKQHVQKNISVALRSWWDSDRIEMIVDPVQHSAIVLMPILFLWKSLVSIYSLYHAGVQVGNHLQHYKNKTEICQRLWNNSFWCY